MAIDKELLLFLKSANIGEDEPDLGAKLMESFLKMFLESKSLPAKIVCMNSGIFLTTEGSPVISLLKDFAEQGTEILSCGTCLDYYKRRDKLAVGQPTDMRATVTAIQNFKKIVTL